MKVFVPPSLRHFEPKRIIPGPGVKYVALEYDLVEALRPRLLVDAGAGDALSFFTYCQSMKDHDIDGSAYAFDTWDPGEPPAHAEASFDAINEHGRKTYPGLYYVVRFAPDEAFRHFGEGTVDFLRLDAARVELCAQVVAAAWLERLRPGGLLVLHGTAQGDGRRLWQELAASGDTVEFADGRGLGVLRKAGGEEPAADLLRLAFVERQGPALERFYAHAREHHQLRRLVSRLRTG